MHKVKRWLVFSLLVHLVTAYFSAGFYDMDEQFQVLEFVHHRIAGVEGNAMRDLPWEFHARCRPWLQPLAYEGIVRLDKRIGIEDPKIWATHIRILSSILGWLALVGLAGCCQYWFKTEFWRKGSVQLLCLFWLIPYIHSRTSSENFSGTVFFFAVTFWTWASRTGSAGFFESVMTGVLLGLSFNLRYQMIAAAGAFVLWVFLFQRSGLRRALVMGVGVFVTIPVAIAVDRIGYGEWVFASWRYLYDHIILGRASQFGVMPAHYYLSNFVQEVPPFGAVILIALILGWTLTFRHLVSFVSLLFFLAHCLVSHKEQRFLYPMVMAVPIVAALGAEQIQERWSSFIVRTQGFWKVFIGAVIIFNLGGMAFLAIRPARAIVGLYDAVYRNPSIQELYFLGSDPYNVGGTEIHFYRNPSLQLKKASGQDEVLTEMKTRPELWLVYENFQMDDEQVSKLKDFCRLEYSVFPNFLKPMLSRFPGLRFANKTSLYRCQL